MEQGAGRPASAWTRVGYNFSLAHGVGPDRHLRARCSHCERNVVFDPGAWLEQGLGGLPLTHFEERLRCACGARRASLEIWSGPAPPLPEDRSIYAFR